MAFVGKDKGSSPDLPFEEQVERAYAKIIRCVNVKEQSSVKMREKLTAAGYSYQASEMALAKALRCHVIDDVRYAECLIRSALSQSKGLHFVLQEIDALGLQAEELEAYKEYLEDHADAMTDRALEYLRRHSCTSKNPQAACYRKLMMRGYGTRVASEAATLYCQELTQTL